MSEAMQPDPQRNTPAAALLALGLGRTEARAGEDDEDGDVELEAFLCALPDLELHGCLGRGGMGRVYRARQIRLDRFVAVKLMNAELGGDPEFRDRFEREARALARLDHPGVVRVHDFGEAGGVFYLIMELVEGPSLRDLMADEITPEQATRIIEQLCDALAFAHARGVVHRDVKPENVLIDPTGRIKVADFGLAKLQQVDHRATTRRVVGTPQYMAPEQLSDPASVDHRADVFAIGVVFYEMLTGQLPVGRFPSPSELGRGDALIDRVVLRALESSREKRFQAASEIREALESRAIDDPETMTQPGIQPTPRRRVSPAVWIAGGIATAGLAGLAVVSVFGGSMEPEAVPEAEVEVPQIQDGLLPDEPDPKAAIVLSANRWPASDLSLLSPDTAIVVGVDWADLRQAPALASLQATLGDDPAWKQCYGDVVGRTHKMIVALDDHANPTEVVAHGDWEPEAFASCLQASPSSDKSKVKVAREPFGGYMRLSSSRDGKPLVSVVVGREGSRLWLSFRKDLDEPRAHELFGGRSIGKHLGQRLGDRVDLGAPIWLLADQFPGEWSGKPVAAWGHLGLWEVLEVDATLAFANDEDAIKAAKVIAGYDAILSNIEDAPKLDLAVKRTAKQVAIQGSVEIPKDLGSGTLKLVPEQSEGALNFSVSFSD